MPRSNCAGITYFVLFLCGSCCTFELETVKGWAAKISEKILSHEAAVTDQQRLIQSFTKTQRGRDIEALADEAYTVFTQLLEKRERAVTKIALLAEQYANERIDTPSSSAALNNYQYIASIGLDQPKPLNDDVRDLDLPCIKNSSQAKYLRPSTHFKHQGVSQLKSSVHVVAEVYDCDKSLLREIRESEALDTAFKENYEQDSTISWQYYCSAKGFMRHFPMATWSDIQGARWPDETDVFDCRLRDWYVESSGASRDIVLLLDATGSMTGVKVSVLLRIVETILTALTPDDKFTVFRVSDRVLPVVPCFGEELVSAIPANTRTFMDNLRPYNVGNQSRLDLGLNLAAGILKNRSRTCGACQQAIVILADDMPEDWTELVDELNKDLRARVFVFLFGDDITTKHAEEMTCNHDGLLSLLETVSEASEEAMRMLRVFERPLVEQRVLRPIVWSGQFAHVQDQRTSDARWKRLQDQQQAARYNALRKNKKWLLSEKQIEADYRNSQYATTLGHYSEENSVPYDLQISVTMPVFDPTTQENITIQLMEESQRNVTRTEVVNAIERFANKKGF